MGTESHASHQNAGLAIHLHIGLLEDSKALGHPHFLGLEINSAETDANHPYSPLPYFTDAIVGLSAYKLLIHSHETLSSNEEALAALLWQRLEPLHEVYQRSNQRIKPLLSRSPRETSAEAQFEQNLREAMRSACKGNGINLTEFHSLIDSLNFFETKRSHPLLFDTQLQLSPATMNILHTLYSLLYNLRALTAVHYNSLRKDTLYESLQIDSVKDYFHAPDLLTNESMLYYHYLSLRKNGLLTGASLDSLGQAFRNFLPHSHYLVNCLPEEFFTQQNTEMLEQSLYTFQIDWLLGTPAGLLYRLREELIGLKEGYDQTFWPELHSELSEEPINTLHVKCILGADHIRQLSEVA